MSELKPCPFCGKSIFGLVSTSAPSYQVVCKGCGVRGAVKEAPDFASAEKAAINAWNNRPRIAELEAEHTALVDGLRSKCDQWWRTEDPLARIIAREVRALLGKESTPPPATSKYIDIVFDGPPANEPGRFVEVENDSGSSIRVGEWVERPDGFWALRLTRSSCPLLGKENEK